MLTRLQKYGNGIVAVFDDGSRVLCYPAAHSLWYPVEESGYENPDDPTNPGGTSLFKWPFPTTAFNENNGRPQDGYRTASRPNHRGIDMAFPPAVGGADIKAIADGVVKFAGWHDDYTPNTANDLTGGYVAWLDHGVASDGHHYGSLYAHMQTGSLQVTTGATVVQGQVLGRVGSTGNSTGDHLHFEIWDWDAVTTPSYDKRINPHTFMATFNPGNEYV